MFWKILLLMIASLIFVLGTMKALVEARQQKPGRNALRDILISVGFALVVGIYPLIQLLQPSEIKEKLEPIPEMAETGKRIEQKIDQLRREIGQPFPYVDGVPQSENFNLRKLFEKRQKHLDNYEYAEALSAFRRAWALKDLKPSEIAALLIHIGIVQYRQNQWDQALGSWKNAVAKAEDADDEEGQAAALGNLGLVYQAKGKWDKAIEFHNRDLEIRKKIGDEHGMAQTFYNLGLVYQDKGEWDKAIEFYNKALKGLEKVGDEHGMARTKGNIALLYKAQGKKEEARELFQEILDIFERIGDKPNAERTRRNLEDL